MSSGISVSRYTSESLRWKEGAEGKLLFLEDTVSWTKQHLSDIRPQAFYMNQPSRATANKTGFLGSSSEILQCLRGIPTYRMLLKSTVVSYLAFSSTEIYGALLTCYHVTCDLTFWNFERKNVDDLCVKQKTDHTHTILNCGSNVHRKLLFTERSKETVYILYICIYSHYG